jgi:hypothetical protein
MQEDGEETKGFAKRAICRELACHTEMVNVTFMRVEGGVDMLEQQLRRWPDWCEDQHS